VKKELGSVLKEEFQSKRLRMIPKINPHGQSPIQTVGKSGPKGVAQKGVGRKGVKGGRSQKCC